MRSVKRKSAHPEKTSRLTAASEQLQAICHYEGDDHEPQVVRSKPIVSINGKDVTETESPAAQSHKPAA